jgi:hypothetical protein
LQVNLRKNLALAGIGYGSALRPQFPGYVFWNQQMRKRLENTPLTTFKINTSKSVDFETT